MSIISTAAFAQINYLFIHTRFTQVFSNVKAKMSKEKYLVKSKILCF